MRMRPSGGATAPDTRHPQDRPEPARGRRRPLAGLGAVAVVASLAFAVPSPASAQTPADPAADATTTTASVAASEDAAGYWTADRRADALATEEAADTEAAAAPAAPSSTPSRLVEHPGLTYVGVLFYVADGRNRTCTASVVDTPEGDAIATAAHCLVDAATGDPTRLATFVPGTRDAQAPSGLWPLGARSVTASWTRTHATADDAGFARVRSLDGRKLEDVVSAARPVFDRPLLPEQGAAGALSVLGYPEAAPYSGRRLVACAGVPQRFRQDLVSLPCSLGEGAGGAPVYTRGVRVPVGGEPRPELRSVVASPANPAGGRAAVVLATWGDEAKRALAALPVG